jgi:hypothetical protein
MKRTRPAAQRGVAALMAVLFLLFMLSVVLVIAHQMAATDVHDSAAQNDSVTALFLAESGLERATYQRASGTACAALGSTEALGGGSFTTTGTAFNPASSTLSAGISAADTVIPVVSVAGYAAHGRITIDSEEINYGQTSAVAAVCAPFAPPCFAGAARAMGGTAAAGHLAGAAARQNQCLIRSTGTANAAVRILETAAAPPYSDFLDSASVVIPTSAQTLATLNSTLPAGDKIIIAVVTFRNTSGNSVDISAGNLRLRRGATVLASNQDLIRVDGTTSPGNNDFPQETQYLLYRDAGSAANPSYNVFTNGASSANATAEVKLLVINVTRSSSFQDGASVGIGAAATTLITHASGLPAGDNIVIAAVRLDNTANGVRSIAANALTLSRGAALATNTYPIDLARANRANRGTGFLLLGRDPGAPANSVYTVTATAGNTGINGEVKIIVINGLLSARTAGAAAVGAAATTMANLVTTLPAGENVVIVSSQYDNSAGGQRNIAQGAERIVFGGVSQSSNPYEINLCTNGTGECDDFTSGLIWHQAGADSNPSYLVDAAANNTGINGSSQILVMHVNIPPTLDWQEIYAP